MGYGDNLMAAGLARGARARGKRVAFGDGRRIIWDQNSEPIFRHNPNVAPPSSGWSSDLEWIAHYRGCRLYNRQTGQRWIWNYDFRAVPGEMFFTAAERDGARRAGAGFVVVEPNVPAFKSCAPNKQWPVERYETVAAELKADGFDVVQFWPGAGHRLKAARQLRTPDFRAALAVLERAALYIGPEGGLHHGAAALGVPAVVLFGGFIPPAVTGYDGHINLTGGATACGSIVRCEHCAAAMCAISVDDVLEAAGRHVMACV
jgi:hypothetical protein